MAGLEDIRLLRRLVEVNERILKVLERIDKKLPNVHLVTGGVIRQIGDPSMLSIEPGNAPKFQVTPTFSGPAFTLDGSKASVTTSDTTNAPADIDLTDDPTGATFVIDLTPGVAIPTGGEAITVTWTYENTDGTVATVTGTLTEEGIVDDVTGGTFTQVA